jgi:hypothetical protein
VVIELATGNGERLRLLMLRYDVYRRWASDHRWPKIMRDGDMMVEREKGLQSKVPVENMKKMLRRRRSLEELCIELRGCDCTLTRKMMR